MDMPKFPILKENFVPNMGSSYRIGLDGKVYYYPFILGLDDCYCMLELSIKGADLIKQIGKPTWKYPNSEYLYTFLTPNHTTVGLHNIVKMDPLLKSKRTPIEPAAVNTWWVAATCEEDLKWLRKALRKSKVSYRQKSKIR